MILRWSKNMKNLIVALKHHPATLKLFWKPISAIIGGGISLWLKFVDKTSKVSETFVSTSMPPTEPVIYVNWHKHLPYLIVQHGKRRGQCCLLVSSAPYMEVIARCCTNLGLSVVRGGSKDTNATAASSVKIVEEIKSQAHQQGGSHSDPVDILEKVLRYEKKSVMLAVDGPSGPAFVPKRGCVELARRTGCAIVPVSYSCSRSQPNRLRWDSLWWPAWFDEIEVLWGSPVLYDPKKDESENIRSVKQALDAINR